MLKSYLIFLCLSVSISGIAQQYQLDSVVHIINDTQLIASQKYDAESRKAELVRYQRQGANDAVQKMERAQVIYDDKGNELYHIFSVWNPTANTWNEEEKTEQEFNAANKLTRVSNHRKRNNHWIKIFENKRSYVQDSIIETDYDTKNDKFQPTHKSISVTNTLDKVKTHEIFLWNAKKHIWQPLNRTSNIYQKDTMIIGFEIVEWKENQWQKQEKVVYKLGKDNLPTGNYTLYKGQKNEWRPVTKFEEESLPEQNKKISSTYKWENTDNKWIIQAQVETYLNKEGKKQDVLFSEIDTSNRQLKLQLEQMHFYDKQGRLIIFQNFDHSNETRTGTQSTVKFDKEGNVIQENRYELDPENDTWNEKMRTEFVYDKNIALDSTFEQRKNLDLFSLNGYNYITNKYAVKQVKIYRYENGKKILSEEFECFYSITK